jgi:hypothetical protein
MNLNDLKPFIDRKWRDDITPRLVDYVRIPAKSPSFDASWAEHGICRPLFTWRRTGRVRKLAILPVRKRWPA